MVQTIRLNKKENYLIDSSTGAILDRYDPNNKCIELVIKLEDSMLNIKSSEIHTEYGGNIIVQYNRDRFIIDDGYQNTLIKAGYIVYKDYDVKKEHNSNTGLAIRTELIKTVRENLIAIADKYNESDIPTESLIQFYSNSESEMKIETEYYDYTFVVDTIDNIVFKNRQRKDNSLPFYPFYKTMDKYGTLYFSIFAEKKKKVEESNLKYKFSSDITATLIGSMGNQYHYIAMPIKNRVLYCKGI